MRRRIHSTLLILSLLGACAPAPLGQTPAGNSPGNPPLALPSSGTDVSSEIRPGSKGQRLEFTGEMEIPAGTSSYAIQSASAAHAKDAMRTALLNLLMPPAQAQEAAVSDGDEPISDSQIANLTATVDGQAVRIIIDKISDTEDGSKRVSYTLKDVPEVNQNAIIEFSSPSGSFKIKGVVAKLDASVKQLDTFDVETTALAEVLINHPKKVKNLTGAEIKALLKSEAVQKLRDAVLQLFVQPASKPVKFETGVKASVDEVLQDQDLTTFLDQDATCSQRGAQCTQKPALPPAVEHPIPTALKTLINRRQQLRVRLVVGVHAPTASERADLLKLGILARLKECVRLKVAPCP